MTKSLKNFSIGLFLFCAVGALFGLVMFLRPTVGDQKQILLVRFSSINKIGVGTRVLFAGKAVGEVTSIQEIYHARETQPSDALGRLYFYQLTLNIDSKTHVYSTDEITIQTSGLLGEKSIAIVPKCPPKGVTSERITDKSPIYADSVDPLENTITQLSDVGEKLSATVSLVKTWFESNEPIITQSITAFASAIEQIDTAVAAINEHQLIAQLTSGTAALTVSAQQLGDALTQLSEGGAFENFGPVVANFKKISTSFEKISETMASGQGTFGKLLQDENLYLQMNAIMSKADTLMNDVNHYGVLFHLNKGWQRTRTQRMARLSQVEDPIALKNYFQTEVDQINTAMARLSIVIDKTQQEEMDSAQFKENLADLLRRVQQMSETLHLYNEQLQQNG